jgi:hypothetical protein
VRGVFPATLAELAELQASRGRFLVLGLRVVPFFAVGALEGDDFPHCFDLLSPLTGLNFLLHCYPGLAPWALFFRRFRGSKTSSRPLLQNHEPSLANLVPGTGYLVLLFTR